MGNSHNRLLFGRTRGGFPAAPIALTAGVIATPLVSVTAMNLNPYMRPDSFWLAALIYGTCMFFPITALVWVAVVDRRTIRGATLNPERSVEQVWLDRAAANSFWLTYMVCGIGSGVVNWMGAPLEVTWTLLAICGVCMVLLGATYLRERTRR